MELPFGKIIVGDALDVLKSWPDAVVDVVFTDPPYGIGKDYGSAIDTRPQADVWKEVHRILKPDGSLHFTCSNKHLPEWLDVVRSMGFRYLHTSVYWNTARVAGNWNGQFAYAWEPWLHFAKGRFRLQKRMMSDVFPWARQEGRWHPCQKHLGTWKAMLEFIPGGVIVDPWIGSGTTGYACETLGRKQWVGIELDPDIARQAQEGIDAYRDQMLAL